jgi:hypothetical protein
MKELEKDISDAVFNALDKWNDLLAVRVREAIDIGVAAAIQRYENTCDKKNGKRERVI